jgi:hypothetical protein
MLRTSLFDVSKYFVLSGEEICRSSDISNYIYYVLIYFSPCCIMLHISVTCNMKNNICNIKNNTYICNIIKEFDMFTLNMCEIFFQDII